MIDFSQFVDLSKVSDLTTLNKDFIKEALEVVDLLSSFLEVDQVVIGGSLALTLYGHDLQRPLGDLDLTIFTKSPATLEQKLKNKFPISTEISHMSDFSHQLLINDIKCDINYNGFFLTKEISRNNKSYYLTELSKIIKAKIRYSIESGQQGKHFDDIMIMIENKPKNKLIFE